MAVEVPETLPGYAPVGGHPALDLINTLAWRASPAPTETIADVEHLAVFATVADLPAAADALLTAAGSDRAAAAAGLDRIRAAREALHGVFSALAADRVPSTDDLTDLAARYGRAVSTAQPTMNEARLNWQWPDAAPWDQLLNSILVATVELLVSGPVHRVKVCGEATCGWLFLDQSKNASRRWCSMDICGSRTKMRRQYHKKKEKKKEKKKTHVPPTPD